MKNLKWIVYTENIIGIFEGNNNVYYYYYYVYGICDMCKAICNAFQRERISMIFVV